MMGWMARLTQTERGIGVLLFLFLGFHALVLGPTDDEAYYWTLAQSPQWAYAFHPPLVAWLLALSQKCFGWIAGPNSNLVLRGPAVLGALATFWLVMRWARGFQSAGRVGIAARTLLCLVCVFVLGWMMVPDVSLLTGLALLFTASWAVLERGISTKRFVALAIGALILLLSKYSGVLAIGSAFLCIWFWAPKASRLPATLALFVGSGVALAPVLYWNWQNDWGSLAYQLKDRHGGEINLTRLLRFWLIQIAAVGPLVFYTFRFSGSRLDRFAAVWTFPALLVFGLQPLWGEFKPHWALVIWLITAMRLTVHVAQGSARKWARAHRWHGVTVGTIAVVLLHFPLLTMITKNPKLDIGNDMVGWKALGAYFATEDGKDFSNWVVVGSRYQTASRAYFELGPEARVTLLPRDQKQFLEWKNFEVTDAPGPEWPTLLRPVIFVSDNRYTAQPEFRGARCVMLKRSETLRFGIPVRWIDIQACYPAGN
jgi:4-amino-4-deoxy-L-arabinose transferase-like glycosyltransferase